VTGTIRILGDGVAAWCCARLLEGSGFGLVVETLDRPKVPALMVSDATQKLLGDVFERRDLFEGLPRIRKRIVSWGEQARTQTFPHSAVVVAETDLVDRIRLPLAPSSSAECSEADWTILASRPLPSTSVEHQFGSRIATASRVKLAAGHDGHSCWVESLERGWLFLLPGGGEEGWLLSVGDAASSLLGESRLIGAQIVEIVRTAGSFACHPRIAEPLSVPGWLACGTAAVSFDPLCGDGTGYASREAILGAAVVRAVAAGGDVDPIVAHYRTRLVAGFMRHLEVCLEFYQTGGSGPWWNQEVNSLHDGLEWCRQQLDGAGGFQYRLNGFDLESIDQSALRRTHS